MLFTTFLSRLVVINLIPKEDTGSEVHDDVDQFIRIETGEGKAGINRKEYPPKDGLSAAIPAEVGQNMINTSAKEDLRPYAIYTPTEHENGTVHKTKADAPTAGH